MHRTYFGITVFFFILFATNGMAAETADAASGSNGVDLASLKGWDIVVADNATEAESYAAEEFRKYYAQASGSELSLNKNAVKSSKHIYIGPGKAMQDSNVGFSVNDFGDEDFRIVVRDNNIVIAGGRPRGTLYGVYQFLEDYLGVRFLTVDHTYVPPVGESKLISAVDRFYHPLLNFRWPYYKSTYDNPEFAARLRVNAVPGSTSQTWRHPGIAKLGGKTGITLAGHSFRHQIPPEKYAAEHPEYYSFFRGKYVASLKPGDINDYTFSGGFVYGMQPCLTNPDVLKIVTESVIAEAKAHPEIESFPVSQDDGGMFCQCSNCTAIIEKEGMSGYVLNFVNKVADALAKECPGKMVSTLAYSDTLSPPRTIKLRPNVQIWFATINTCVNHHLDDPACRDNTIHSEYIRKWNEICSNFYIWDYSANLEYTNFQLPVANFESIEYKTRYLIANGVKGIFMQGEASSYGTELEDMRLYVASKLLWDPNQSSQKLMKEFLDLHLGKSGEPVLEWINYMRKKAVASSLHCRCVGGAWKDYGLDHNDALKGLEAFNKAMTLAENETIKSRVEKMSVCAYRAVLEPVWYVEYVATDVPYMMQEQKGDQAKVSEELKSEMRPYAKRFFDLCDKYDVTRTGEGDKRSIKAAKERLEGVLGSLNGLEEKASPIHLSNHPQLFLDDYLVRKINNVTFQIKSPQKHPEPVIVREYPWEKRIINIYGTVMFDDKLGKFRCWYLANENKDGIPDTPEHPATVEYYMCYAESNDGIKWVKPMVGDGKFGMHEKHNIVIPGGHGFCVLPTPDDPDPNKRYKGVGGGIYGFSPDGIKWKTYDWKYAVKKNDTSSCVVKWNGEYLGFVRYQIADTNWPAVMRGVGITTSNDFTKWTPKELVFKTDEKDGYPWTQPYGLAVTPYGDVLIGLSWLIHLDQIEGNNSLGYEDVQLVVSRNGRNWQRVANRDVFLKPTPGTWDRGRIHGPATSMFVKDDLVYIYYSASDARHGEGGGNTGIGMATLPADRFVAVRPADANKEGILETSLFCTGGTKLLINAEIGKGNLLVEVIDDSGKVIKGYGKNNCRLSISDKLRYNITWEDNGQEKCLRDVLGGKPAALRFILNNCSLYAFQILE